MNKYIYIYGLREIGLGIQQGKKLKGKETQREHRKSSSIITSHV